ncbi:MAG: 16S rRNA (cytosine(1402)-N(4))-methyltransferase RsmH [Burkholderiaceae bacterium]|nr:16S rRNA (cytosine(1402)-N(4))-methyltransferase RsmH [Burkholderiaceae bacterium]
MATSEQSDDRSHVPVLAAEAVAALRVRADGIYVDGTFGRGGHSRRILDVLGKGGRLVALDRDPDAVAAGRLLERRWRDDRFELFHARFSELERVLDERGIGGIDGLLLDLGISSPQVDDPARGFSFLQDGPLDMRMDPTRGMSARQWLEHASEQEIAEVLKRYGDERFAVPIAAAIVARRGQAGGAGFQTTRQLADVVAAVVRRRQKRPEVGKNPATRTFQALRIHVNDEGAELSRALAAGMRRLVPGGRLAVISFHSIEDRMVKQFISLHSGKSAERHPVTGAPLSAPSLVSRGRILPGADEVKANPRARSAVLRVAERTEAEIAP